MLKRLEINVQELRKNILKVYFWFFPKYTRSAKQYCLHLIQKRARVTNLWPYESIAQQAWEKSVEISSVVEIVVRQRCTLLCTHAYRVNLSTSEEAEKNRRNSLNLGDEEVTGKKKIEIKYKRTAESRWPVASASSLLYRYIRILNTRIIYCSQRRFFFFFFFFSGLPRVSRCHLHFRSYNICCGTCVLLYEYTYYCTALDATLSRQLNNTRRPIMIILLMNFNTHVSRPTVFLFGIRAACALAFSTCY